MRTRRVAAIWVPGLPLQVAGRDDPAMRERPVAVTDGETVVARNRLATEAGVAVGMRVAEALTHVPDLACRPYDARRVQATWDVVLDQLDALGPTVEDTGLGHALVDLTGAGVRERPLVRRTLAALRALLDLHARAAVADGPFVALVAARRARQEGEVVVIPRGKSVAYLAPLPAATLPLPGGAVADLHLLGVRTVGAFAALRLSDVQRQWGGVGMAALALAVGQDARPLVPHPREAAESLAYPFEPPTDDLAPVLFVARTLLNSHAATLRREGLVAGGLRLVLTVEGRDAVATEQRWAAPAVPGEAEFDALRLALDARAVAGEDGEEPPRFAALTLTLLDRAPDAGTQLPLFGAEAIRQREAVGHLLTRLHALLGAGGVEEAVPTDAHLPEERWATRPYRAERVGTEYAGPEDEATPLLPALPGLAWCEPPEAITVTWWGERPVALRIETTEREVVTALGPYRAAGGWWRGDGGHDRAYWLLVTGDQTLHLVAEDRRTGAWARAGVAE